MEKSIIVKCHVNRLVTRLIYYTVKYDVNTLNDTRMSCSSTCLLTLFLFSIEIDINYFFDIVL